ncbi:MAG: PIG-L family deacetylase [Kiritimatiellae bacterium]|nr:PIG-L family deacetylase [Kiritimatiellia bacterium]
MEIEYDILCISPHLDDAVLSCGGYLGARAAEGKRVLVYTVAASGPVADTPLTYYARRYMERCGLTPDAGALRRAEDAEACGLLGVDFCHGGMLEAIYRTDPMTGVVLYPDHRQVFGRPAALEATGLVESLVEQFRGLPSACEVLSPLGVGGHVDHRLVRRAAEVCFGERLRYYEDFPYAGKWFSVWKCTRPKAAWQAEVCGLDEYALKGKMQALEKYASQVEVLFGSPAAMSSLVRQYTQRCGGERYWYRHSSA